MSRVIGIVQGIALVGIIVLILASIILRNFFDYGLVWVFEATGFLMVSLVFLGVPKNLYNDDDIAVDFLTSRTGTFLRRCAFYFSKMITLAVSFTLVYFLYLHSLKFGQLRTPTLEIPHWFFYCSVLIGPGLAVVIVLWQFTRGSRIGVDHDRN